MSVRNQGLRLLLLVCSSSSHFIGWLLCSWAWVLHSKHKRNIERSHMPAELVEKQRHFRKPHPISSLSGLVRPQLCHMATRGCKRGLFACLFLAWVHCHPAQSKNCYNEKMSRLYKVMMYHGAAPAPYRLISWCCLLNVVCLPPSLQCNGVWRWAFFRWLGLPGDVWVGLSRWIWCHY